MPFFDLAGPTGLVYQWGWLLLTRANGVVYLLLFLVFLLGIFVPLPRSKES